MNRKIIYLYAFVRLQAIPMLHTVRILSFDICCDWTYKLNGRQNLNLPVRGSTIAEDKMWTNKIETRISDG